MTIKYMFFSTHTIVGSFIGKKIPSAPVAILVGATSHLVLDAIPHWGRQPEIFWPVAITDGLIGGTVVLYLAKKAFDSRKTSDINSFLAAIAAGAPDWDKPFRELLGIEPWPEVFNNFHKIIQTESPTRFPMEISILLSLLVVFGITNLSLFKENNSSTILKRFKQFISNSITSSRADSTEPGTVDPTAPISQGEI